MLMISNDTESMSSVFLSRYILFFYKRFIFITAYKRGRDSKQSPSKNQESDNLIEIR